MKNVIVLFLKWTAFTAIVVPCVSIVIYLSVIGLASIQSEDEHGAIGYYTMHDETIGGRKYIIFVGSNGGVYAMEKRGNVSRKPKPKTQETHESFENKSDAAGVLLRAATVGQQRDSNQTR